MARLDPVKRVLREEARTWSRVAAIIVCVGIAQGVWTVYLQPSPLFRAFVGMQAYDSVEPVIVSYDENTLTLQGTMVKRRCTFADLAAFIDGAQGHERAWLDKSAEDVRRPSGNRPASDIPQAWGPWTIRHYGPPATRWEIISVHDCPEGDQTTVFASGTWPQTSEGE